MLSIPKGKKVKLPNREPDMHSKRGIPYWFGPDWVRDTNGSVNRIIPIKVEGDVHLHMLSKDGHSCYIRGSIQEEFKRWHEDNQIDCILLGMDEDELLLTNWEYE